MAGRGELQPLGTLELSESHSLLKRAPGAAAAPAWALASSLDPSLERPTVRVRNVAGSLLARLPLCQHR